MKKKLCMLTIIVTVVLVSLCGGMQLMARSGSSTFTDHYVRTITAAHPGETGYVNGFIRPINGQNITNVFYNCNDTGEIAFCMSSNWKSPGATGDSNTLVAASQVGLVVEPAVQNRIKNIIRMAVSKDVTEFDWNGNHYSISDVELPSRKVPQRIAAQLAIWYVLLDSPVTSGNKLDGSDGGDGLAVKYRNIVYPALMDRGTNWNADSRIPFQEFFNYLIENCDQGQRHAIDIVMGEPRFEQNHYFIDVNIQAVGAPGGATIQVDGLPEISRIDDKTSGGSVPATFDINQESFNRNYTLVFPAWGNQNRQITITGRIYDNKDLLVYNAPRGGVQIMAVAGDGRVEVGSNQSSIVTPKLSILLSKAINSSNGKTGDAKLNNGIFGLYSDPSCEEQYKLLESTTDDSGEARFPDVGVRNYWIKEIQPPEGSNLNDTIFPVDVNALTKGSDGNYTYSFGLENRIITSNLKIVKRLGATDYDPEINLEGSQFTAYLKSDPSQSYTSNISGADGVCYIEGIPYGEYTIEETKVPDAAYKVANFDVKFEEDGKTYEFTKVDESKKMLIEFTKKLLPETVNKTDAKVSGAYFTIYKDQACTQIEAVVGPTDSTGFVRSGTMRTGTYYVKETVFPEGIDPDGIIPGEGITYKDKVYVVSYDNKTQGPDPIVHKQDVINKPMMGKIEVIKYDDIVGGTEEKASEGAILRLTLDSHPDCYYLVTINKDGYAEFVNEDLRELYYPYTIPYGKYTITEDRESDTGIHTRFFIQPQPVNIQKQAQREYYIVEDRNVPVYIKIQKTDSDANNANVFKSGAWFKVWDCQENKFINQRVYEEDNELGLHSGDYTEIFKTNDEGYLILPQKVIAGKYIIYEIKAPDGYYLNEDWRLPENTGDYGKSEKGGKLIDITKSSVHIPEDTPANNDELYYLAEMPDEALKGRLEIHKYGEMLTDVRIDETKYGSRSIPVFERRGLKGVTYNIYAEEDIMSPDGRQKYVTKGQLVDTITTGEDGIATTKDLFLGKYRIVETVTPEGYITDKDIEGVELKNADTLKRVETTTKELDNVRQKLKLTFEKRFEDIKYSNEENPVKKAVFGVYTDQEIQNVDGRVIISKDSLVDIIEVYGDNVDNDVTSTIDLPEGRYYVKEIDTSYPYSISEEERHFELRYSGNENEFITYEAEEFGNTYDRAQLALLKISTSSQDDIRINKGQLDESNFSGFVEGVINDIKALSINQLEDYIKEKNLITVPGAKYKIYTDSECKMPLYVKSGDKYVEAEVTTDENGLIVMEDLPLGVYYIVEVEAPKGYELSKDIKEVTLSVDNNDAIVYDILKDASVKSTVIEKLDSFTGEKVENCTFEIRDENDDLLLKSTTDEKGDADIPLDLFENGKKYTYTEVEAPDIYELNTEPHEFTAEFDEDGNWITKKEIVENVRKKSKITLEKSDFADSTPVPNCKFELRSLETNFVVEGVTDKNGVYVFEDIPYGEYTYTELEAPEEYLIDTEPHYIKVDAEEMKIQVKDEKAPDTGDIQVYIISLIYIISVFGIVYTIRRKVKNN